MKYTYLIILALVGVLAALLVVTGCSAPQDTTKQPTQTVQNAQIHIATTFYPLYDLTKNIVGDKGTVYSIVPAGSEPHEYEPTAGDFQKLNSADAFVTMGVEFGEFEDTLASSVPASVTIIPSGKGIQQLKANDDEKIIGGLDPHIWLSPKNAQKMVDNIMNGLVQVDPDNTVYYLQNGQKVIDDLQALDAEFAGGLSNCQKDVVLVGHNAFSYLGRDYGFRTLFLGGLEPESEPTPQELAAIVDAAKENHIKYVFYEELVDPRISNIIANEVGAQTMVLSPLEGPSESNPSDTYFTLMRQNLHNLEVALECQ